MKRLNFVIEDIPQLWQSTVGLERETPRIQEDGHLSQQTHSDQWGSRQHHPYIQTDFAEAQLEMITPPCRTSQEVYQWLQALHQIVAQTIEGQGEYLWPFSMPGIIPENRDSIKVAQLADLKERDYREWIASYYGKDLQLISGIHYNIEINPQVIQQAIRRAAGQDQVSQNLAKGVQTETYLRLTRLYLRYRWILTYLLGASPYVDPTYQTKLYGQPPQEVPMRSIRQSRYGYKNHPNVQVSYESLPAYVEDVEDYVDQGYLSLEKELYTDVRFRRASPLRELLDQGINYIELRNFDLNPFDPYGMTVEDMDFIKLFVISLLYLPEDPDTDAVTIGNQRQQKVAEQAVDEPIIDLAEADKLFDLMAELLAYIPNNQALKEIVASKRQQLAQPELTLAGRIVNEVGSRDQFLSFGLSLAQDHQAVYIDRPYSLHGFEALELSSQDLIKEALRLGFGVDLLDAEENLLQVTYQDQQEYIKNANMTRLDPLVSYYLMENKVATKRLLAESGIRVPVGAHFTRLEEALAYYPTIQDKAVVIKPKNTNYGIGITIFKEATSLQAYQQALEVALAEDSTLIVEEFIPGTELRFYVQAGEVLAICERQAAHVVGDGVHNIYELVEIENQNPLRGLAHYTPLTQLELGAAEAVVLADQGYGFDSIPPAGQTVFLRSNSNISTGGVSIDRTDEVLEDYKAIAVQAAEALQATICGVDMLVQDWTQPIGPDNHYAIIEANFNPMITLHRHPGIGQGRRLGVNLLQALFTDYPF